MRISAWSSDVCSSDLKTAGHMAAPPSDSLGSAVEHHLRSYFAAHEDGLPASGLYDRILREVERPLTERSLAAPKGNQIRAAKQIGRASWKEQGGQYGKL